VSARHDKRCGDKHTNTQASKPTNTQSSWRRRRRARSARGAQAARAAEGLLLVAVSTHSTRQYPAVPGSTRQYPAVPGSTRLPRTCAE
jgi:hypothetical protein